MVKVSFVCPVFNKKNYLPEVLKSIKKQNGLFQKEYIFINDGSNDGSYEYLKTTTKKWKNVKIINQNNKGPAIATQNGIEISSGDYLKLVGADDVMSPGCTEFLLNIIEKNRAIAAFSRYKLVKNFENLNFNIQYPKNQRINKNPLLKSIVSSYSGTSPNLYCNNAIKKSGGCNKKLFIEDFSLVLGISQLGSFCFVDNITSFGPIDDPSRIMVGKQTQLIHDFNAALYYFIKENKSICNNLKKLACKKALGRSEKWARRLKGQSIFNKMNWFKIKFWLGNKDYIQILKESCLFFYNDFNDELIRYKIDYSP